MPQFEASLNFVIYDLSRIVNYDRDKFIVQATVATFVNYNCNMLKVLAI